MPRALQSDIVKGSSSKSKRAKSPHRARKERSNTSTNTASSVHSAADETVLGLKTDLDTAASARRKGKRPAAKARDKSDADKAFNRAVTSTSNTSSHGARSASKRNPGRSARAAKTTAGAGPAVRITENGKPINLPHGNRKGKTSSKTKRAVSPAVGNIATMVRKGTGKRERGGGGGGNIGHADPLNNTSDYSSDKLSSQPNGGRRSTTSIANMDKVTQHKPTADNMTDRENSVVSQFSNRTHTSHSPSHSASISSRTKSAVSGHLSMREFPPASPIVRARDTPGHGHGHGHGNGHGNGNGGHAPKFIKPEKSIILDEDGTLVINPGQRRPSRPSKDSGTSTASGVTTSQSSSFTGGSVKQARSKRRSSISEDQATNGALIMKKVSSNSIPSEKLFQGKVQGRASGTGHPTAEFVETHQASDLELLFAEGIDARTHMEVVVFGSIAMDLIATVPTHPKKNTTMAAMQLETKNGGKGANEAVAVSRLDVPVRMIGRVKNDGFGRELQSSLQHEGIDTEGVVVDENGESTGMSMIISADDGTGKNTVACLGANQCCGNEELDIANRYMRTHPEIGILLMQNEVTHNAIVRLARIAYNARKLVIFKASPIREASDVSEDLYPKIDVLVVNEYEAPILLGWVETQPDRFPLRNLQHAMLAAKELQETKKCSAIVILSPFGHVCRIKKEGKVDGWHHLGMEKRFPLDRAISDLSDTSAVHANNLKQFARVWRTKAKAKHYKDETTEVLMIPPMRTEILDIIGAADAAVGGLTAALAERLPMRYAMIWATACGALSCRAVGAQDSMPTKEALQAFMVERKLHVDPSQWTPDDLWAINGASQVDGHEAKFALMFSDHDILEESLSVVPGLRGGTYTNSKARSFYKRVADFQKQTFMHIAVVCADMVSVGILIKYGASVCLPLMDRYGLLPIDRAYECWRSARQPERRSLFRTMKWMLWTVHEVDKQIEKLQKPPPPKPEKADPAASPAAAKGAATLAAPDGAGAGKGKGKKGGNSKKVSGKSKGKAAASPKKSTKGKQKVKSRLVDGMYSDGELAASIIDFDAKGGMLDSVQHKRIGALLLWLIFGYDVDDRDLTRRGEDEADVARFGIAEDLLLRLLHIMVEAQNMPDLKAKANKGILSTLAAVKTELRSAMTSDGLTLMHGAAYLGSAELIRLLKDLGIWIEGDAHTCTLGRTALHYAVMSGSTEACGLLITWKMELDNLDKMDQSPLHYCPDLKFRNEVLRLGKYRDVFISYGHQEEVSPFTHQLSADLRAAGVSTWIDTDIERGERWREAIQDAIKYSSAVIVVLSKKWVDSNYCRGEANLALDLHKQIFVVVPPVSPEQRAVRRDIPEHLRKSMSERQFLTAFETKTPEMYKTGLDELSLLCSELKTTWTAKMLADSSLTDEKPRMYLPIGANTDPTYDHKYIFVACGGTNFEGHFAELLKDALNNAGMAVKVGYKGQHYPELRSAIMKCTTVVLVIAEGDDQQFLSRMLQESAEGKRPVLMCPYHVASDSEGGMGYTAASLGDFSTACFTDWVGNGFQSTKSPIFQQLFAGFKTQLEMLDPELADRAKASSALTKYIEEGYADVILNRGLDSLKDMQPRTTAGRTWKQWGKRASVQKFQEMEANVGRAQIVSMGSGIHNKLPVRVLSKSSGGGGGGGGGGSKGKGKAAAESKACTIM